MIEIILLIFLLVWIISGISAFFMSLACFGYNGTVTDKFIGLLVAFLLGPFYWLYYSMSKSYCKN